MSSQADELMGFGLTPTATEFECVAIERDERGLGDCRDNTYGCGATRTGSQVDREHAGVARCIQVIGAVGSDSRVCSVCSGAREEGWLSTI